VSCLLVLDNLHWLSDYEWIPIAEFIRKIDPTCSKVLVTYRSPWKSTVSISGFVERPPLEDLDMPSSINLLLTGRPAPRLSWYQLDDDERKRLIQLAKACRRHPYFLQLAAARLNLQSFERLYDELKELKGEFQEASDRFLADQIALLDSDSKNLFPKLSVFPASFDRQAAAAIGNNGDPVDDALLNLTKLRLLIYSPENERYHFHELTREYSKKSLRSEELGNLNKKHAEYFLQQALAARNILKTEKAIAGVILAESERTNWLTGARFYENQKDWQRVVEYGYAIDDPLEKAGYWNDRIIILKKAVNAAIQLGNKKSISSLQHNLGIAYHQQGDYTTAKKYYEESLEIKKALGDKVGQANSLHQLGLLAQDQGDYTTAKKYYEESLEIKKGFEDKSSISVSFQHLGMLAYVQGDYKTARIYYQKSLEMCIVLADKPCIGASLLHLGMLAQDQGDFYTADKYFQTSLKIFQAFGDKPALSSSLHQLGMLAHAQHDYTTAMKYYQTSLEIIKVLGDKAREAKSLHHLGMLVMDQGDYDTARRYYLKSLKIKRALGDKAGVSKSFHQLGIVAMEDGDYAAARKYYQTSFQIEKELENKVGMAISNVQMALLEEKEGNFSKAFELISLAEQQLGQLNSRYVAQVRGFRERIEREKG
jgi:tetratricopeptide (TPR) repeat protein